MTYEMSVQPSLAKAYSIVTELKKLSDGQVILGYSGGKDSIVCLDLLHRAGFSRIVCMYWYLVPGLRVVEPWFEFARKRYGVTEILQVPSMTAVAAVRHGIHMPLTQASERAPARYGILDASRLVQKRTGLKWLVFGFKESDSLERRGEIANTKGLDVKRRISYPIGYFKPKDVRDYFRAAKIPRHTHMKGMNGITLRPKHILWLYDEHREDYERVRLVFPGVENIVRRREFFPETATPQRRRRGKKASQTGDGATA